jgi:hypothetical protein
MRDRIRISDVLNPNGPFVIVPYFFVSSFVVGEKGVRNYMLLYSPFPEALRDDVPTTASRREPVISVRLKIRLRSGEDRH